MNGGYTGEHVNKIMNSVENASKSIVTVAEQVENQGASSGMLALLLFYKKQQIQITYYVMTLYAALAAITFTYKGFDQQTLFSVLSVILAIAGLFLVGNYYFSIRKHEDEMTEISVGDKMASVVTTGIQVLVLLVGVFLLVSYLYME